MTKKALEAITVFAVLAFLGLPAFPAGNDAEQDRRIARRSTN